MHEYIFRYSVNTKSIVNLRCIVFNETSNMKLIYKYSKNPLFNLNGSAQTPHYINRLTLNWFENDTLSIIALKMRLFRMRLLRNFYSWHLRIVNHRWMNVTLKRLTFLLALFHKHLGHVVFDASSFTFFAVFKCF